MNKENIKKVIAVIRNEENFFNMFDYSVSAECDSPSCICGWANHLAGYKYLADPYKAAKWLGIDGSDSYEDMDVSFHDLFQPPFSQSLWSKITREEAIVTLENLMETGEIDWSHVSD